MRIKALLVSAFLLLLVSLAGMIAVFILSGKNSSLFLALANDLSSPKIDIHNIEEFSKTVFPLTYEILSSERAGILNESPVTLVGTTAGFHHIMGLSMVEGSFFSAQDWTGKLRHAVLNEKAADVIFGSYKVAGSRFRMRSSQTRNIETWIVTGVIRDGYDEAPRVYIPSSVQHAGQVNALALVISGNINDETYVKNALKSLGIHDRNYSYLSFGAMRRLFGERILAVPLVFFSLLLLSLVKPLIGLLLSAVRVLKNDLKELYPGEILKKRGKSLVGVILPALGLVLSPVITLVLLVKLASMCLPWQDITTPGGLDRSLFYPYLARLFNLDMISFLFFLLSATALCLFFPALNIFINNSLKFQNNLSKTKSI